MNDAARSTATPDRDALREAAEERVRSYFDVHHDDWTYEGIVDAALAGSGPGACHCGRPWADHDTHYPEGRSGPEAGLRERIDVPAPDVIDAADNLKEQLP